MIWSERIIPHFKKKHFDTCGTPLSCFKMFTTVTWSFAHVSKHCTNKTALATLKDSNGGKELD